MILLSFDDLHDRNAYYIEYMNNIRDYIDKRIIND